MARLTDDPQAQLPRLTSGSARTLSYRGPFQGVMVEEFTWILESLLDMRDEFPAAPEHAGVLNSALTSLRAWMAREGINQPSSEYEALRAWLDTYGDRLVTLVVKATGVELCKRLLFMVHVLTPDIDGDIMLALSESSASRGVRDTNYLATPGMTLGESLKELEREKAAAQYRLMVARDYDELSQDLLIALLVGILCARHPSVDTVVTPRAAVISRVARFEDV